MNLQLLLCSICSSLSIISQSLLIFGYFRVKMMWSHPEVLVIWQCFSQIILDSHWFTGIYPLKSLLLSNCKYIGAVFVLFYYLSWNYIAFLSIEILIKIKSPLNCDYKKRLHFYHFSAHLSSLIVFCLIISAQNNDGLSVVGTCFVQKSSIYGLLVFFPVVFHVPLCTVIIVYILRVGKNNREAKQFRHHSIVALTFTICWGTCALDYGLSYWSLYLNSYDFEVIVFSLGSSAGFLVFLARMTQKGLFSKLMKALFSRKKKNILIEIEKNYSIFGIVNESDSIISLISNSFESITCQVIEIQATSDVLEGLTKYFKYCLNSDKDIKRTVNLQFNISQGKTIEIEHYFFNHIRKIMQTCGISYHDLIQYFLSRSFCLKENLEDLQSRCRNVSGKSGAFFYFTKNKEFIIKSIKPHEIKVLSSMIKDYSDLISSSSSLLVKIFGVFKISTNNTSPRLLIIMENLGRYFDSPLIFDLKGSTHMRKSSNFVYRSFSSIPVSQVYKDIDFLNCYDREINHKDGKDIFKSLEIDTSLLNKHDIMDYSLLIFLEQISSPRGSMIKSCNSLRMGNYVCSIGIIDFLQGYSYRKKLETNLNKLKKDQSCSFSCIPPDAYRNRFLKLMFEIFMNSPSSP